MTETEEEKELRNNEKECREELKEAEKAVLDGFQQLARQRSVSQSELKKLRAQLSSLEAEQRAAESQPTTLSNLQSRKQELETLMDLLLKSRMRSEMEVDAIETEMLDTTVRINTSSPGKGAEMKALLEREQERVEKSKRDVMAVEKDVEELKNELDAVSNRLEQAEESHRTLESRTAAVRSKLAAILQQQPLTGSRSLYDAQRIRILKVTGLKDKLNQIISQRAGLEARRTEEMWLNQLNAECRSLDNI